MRIRIRWHQDMPTVAFRRWPRLLPTWNWKCWVSLSMGRVCQARVRIRLLMGCEINILDTKGSLDLTDEQIGWLDLAIAGIHAAWYQGGTKDENTEGMIRVIKNPKIHIISHPGDGSAEMDFEQLVLAAKEAHTLLEVNNHSLAPQRKKTVARDNNLEILRLCKKYDVPTILGSDAHISFQIADYERLYPLLVETDFPDELIMNYWPDKFFDYLGIQR